MIDDTTKKKLELLDKMIMSCNKCDLCKNGHAKPYWTEKSQYVIIGEAPGADEVHNNTPFIGRAGNILWEQMDKIGLTREDFLIINSVNCRPVDGKRNGKPKPEEMRACYPWVRKYLKVFKPSKGIILGVYGLFTIFGENVIMRHNGSVEYHKDFDIMFLKSIHPAFCMYNPEAKGLLHNNMLLFGEMKDGKEREEARS